MSQFLNWANKNGIPIPENTAVNDITKLTISNPHITELPESLSELSKLCELEISSCDRLTLIGDIIEQLPSLFSFTVWNCPSLLKLSDKISSLKKLQFLRIRTCHAIEFLPESISDLDNLLSLTICDCSKLQEIPNDLGDSSLRELFLSGCPNVKFLPTSIMKSDYLRLVLAHNK